MAYTIDLLQDIRHRYITLATLHDVKDAQPMPDVRVLLDTGAFNTMIDVDLVDTYGALLPFFIPVTIGGHSGEAQGCVLYRVSIGNFELTRVFALAYPFKDWLTQHIVLGTNVMNNWDFATSRVDNKIRFSERIPDDAPNKNYPYQNYFINGEYVTVQSELLN